jgi:serine/threonine protein kinase
MKSDGNVEKLRSFTFDILNGLKYIHEKGIVHMDMKPANLMIKPVSNPNEYPMVKIADFGLSRLLDSDLTVEIEKRCGTDKYIPPEVRDGAKVTTAVDMWCFGLILHLLTVGFLPFALKWTPGQPLKFPPRHWKKYDRTGLIDLIIQCLHVDPRERITAEQALCHEWFSSRTYKSQ